MASGPAHAGRSALPAGGTAGSSSTVSGYCLLSFALTIDTLIKLLLTIASTATGMFTATAGYLYMAHSMGNPSYAPFAALLCGGVPFLAIRAGAAVLSDA